MEFEFQHLWTLLSYVCFKVQNFMQRFRQKFLTFPVETAYVNCSCLDCCSGVTDNKNCVWFENDYRKPNDKLLLLTFSQLAESKKAISSLRNDRFQSQVAEKLLSIVHNLCVEFHINYFNNANAIIVSKFQVYDNFYRCLLPSINLLGQQHLWAWNRLH